MPGEIITFYSYKGGTGRSMALANVGCRLAAPPYGKGRGVLMIDWDLEAPGLHRYFQHLFAGRRDGDEMGGRPGLLELFSELEREIPPDGYENEDQAAEHADRLAQNFSARRYALPLEVPGLYLLKAGRFDEDYSTHVNTFDWEGLYRRSPPLFRALAERWAEEFDYILIDSRTGLTDTSGICTMLMPEKLVVVFTPNRQSFTGVANLVRKATKYRKNSDDLRPLIVFPLPSRIEGSLINLRNSWRFGDPDKGIVGYQPLFEGLFREVYGLAPEQCDLSEYFEKVQIQQTPDYAYGEEIAVLVEMHSDRLSLTSSYEIFTERLVMKEGPWKRPSEEKDEPVEAAEAKKADVRLAADRVYTGLSAEERQRALRLLARLVTVAPEGEGGRDTTAHVKYGGVESAALQSVDALIKAGLVVASRDAYGEEPTLEIADEALVRDWQPLREWLDQNRDFLFWRQKLKTYLTDWEQGGRSTGDLLSGSTLAVAERYLEERPEDLNGSESSYIKTSIRSRLAGTRLKVALIFGAVLGLLALLIWIWRKWPPSPNTDNNVTITNVNNANITIGNANATGGNMNRLANHNSRGEGGANKK